MNPVVYTLGPIQIHAFTAWIMAGVTVGVMILLAVAVRRQERWLSWFDVAVGAVVGSVIGARAGHVWLNWAYFSAHTDQITRIASGGLDWHGAVLGGLVAALIVMLVRRVSFLDLMDALALVLPFGASTLWLACGAANCGYGLEVHTLADFPSWLVTESPDVYGVVAPRLNLPPVGVALAAVVLVVVLILTLFGWMHGQRFWFALALYSLGMAVIGFFRAEYVPIWFDHRADQILDLAVAFVSILSFAIVGLIRLRLSVHSQGV